MSFSDDIKKFTLKCKSNSDAVVRKTVFDVMASIDEMSPVGNPSRWADWNKGGVAENEEHWLVKTGFVHEGYVGGHFRANWQLGIGALPKDEIEGTAYKGKLQSEQSKIPVAASGLIYYYANNAPYAQALEDGHSKQAPHGMVALTKARFQGIVSQAAQAVNK